MPFNYIVAYGTAPLVLTGSPQIVTWATQASQGGPYFALGEDTETWTALVDGTYVIYAEPEFDYADTLGLLAQGELRLAVDFADVSGPTLGDYLNLIWNYIVQAGVSLYNSYATPPLHFYAGDSFTVKANYNSLGGVGTLTLGRLHAEHAHDRARRVTGRESRAAAS